MGQLAVADENSQAPVIEKFLVYFRNTIDDAGKAERVVGPMPLRALKRKASRDGAVHIGIFIGLDITVGQAGAHKGAEVGRDFLFDIHTYATPTSVFAHSSNVSGRTGRLCQIDRVLEAAHASATEE